MAHWLTRLFSGASYSMKGTESEIPAPNQDPDNLISDVINRADVTPSALASENATVIDRDMNSNSALDYSLVEGELTHARVYDGRMYEDTETILSNQLLDFTSSAFRRTDTISIEQKNTRRQSREGNIADMTGAIAGGIQSTSTATAPITGEARANVEATR